MSIKKDAKEKVRTAAKKRSIEPEEKPFGRPREYDRVQVAKDLIEWAQKDDSFNLNGFSAEYMITPSKVSDWSREDPNFREAFELAKAYLGARRERGLAEGKVHVKAYDLNASVYDGYLKQERREDISFALETKAAIEQRNGTAPNDESIDNLIADLKKLKNAPKPKAD